MTDKATQVQYLEIVTPNVNETCAALTKLQGVSFKGPEPMLGNAHVAVLSGGGQIGVRAPMRDDEDPVVRPYLLVDDIQAACAAAEEAGAEFAMPATEIPGHGTFAIYFLGGIQYGLWQI
ncbi:MAG: hydroxylase [Pseudomonadota bacterium]